MVEGLFQPSHLWTILMLALLVAEPLVVVICLFLVVLRLSRIDKSVRGVLAELQARLGS
jgi:hypothetical protein